MREFCPKDCPVLKGDGVCEGPSHIGWIRCFHLDDEKVPSPIPVKMRWTRTLWRDRKIVGVNHPMGDWILDDDSRVKKGSPLLK